MVNINEIMREYLNIFELRFDPLADQSTHLQAALVEAAKSQSSPSPAFLRSFATTSISAQKNVMHLPLKQLGSSKDAGYLIVWPLS